MTAKEYRQATLSERKRHNQAIERRNIERDIKRDNERREQERQYRNSRIFSNVLSAPQTASNVLRSIFSYLLIIMLIVNIVRISSSMPPLTVSSFFELMSQCPDFDFSRARLVIESLSWDTFEGALFNSFVPLFRVLTSMWNVILFFCECVLDFFSFAWWLISYFFGWYVPV